MSSSHLRQTGKDEASDLPSCLCNSGRFGPSSPTESQKVPGMRSCLLCLAGEGAADLMAFQDLGAEDRLLLSPGSSLSPVRH